MRNFAFLGDGITYVVACQKKLHGTLFHYKAGAADECRRLFNAADMQNLISEITTKGTITLDGKTIQVAPDQQVALARFLEKVQ